MVGCLRPCHETQRALEYPLNLAAAEAAHVGVRQDRLDGLPDNTHARRGGTVTPKEAARQPVKLGIATTNRQALSLETFQVNRGTGPATLCRPAGAHRGTSPLQEPLRSRWHRAGAAVGPSIRQPDLAVLSVH